MRKIIKSIIVFTLIAIMGVVIFSACSKTPEGNGGTTDKDTTIETPDNGVKHYEIELTKDNFKEFLEYKISTVYTSTVYYTKDTLCEIKGVLNFAYYKDVTVSFSVGYTNSLNPSKETVYTGSFTVKLNAAGNYSFYTKEEAAAMQNLAVDYESVTLIGVSGVVIFDI